VFIVGPPFSHQRTAHRSVHVLILLSDFAKCLLLALYTLVLFGLASEQYFINRFDSYCQRPRRCWTAWWGSDLSRCGIDGNVLRHQTVTGCERMKMRVRWTMMDCLFAVNKIA